MTWFPWEVRLASQRTTDPPAPEPGPQQVRNRPDRRGPSRRVRRHARPLGLVRAAARRRPRDLRPRDRPAPGRRRAGGPPGNLPIAEGASFPVRLYRLPGAAMIDPKPRSPAWAKVVLLLILLLDALVAMPHDRPDGREESWASPPGRWSSAESEPSSTATRRPTPTSAGGWPAGVMYRDVSENKPPLGYWLYTLAVAIGGANETTIRLMPIPYVLATIALVWWLGLRLRGPVAACVAAWLYSLLGTDPYLFGNGANMEHFLNLFAVASLAAMVRSFEVPGRRWLLLAGAGVGAASLVKQVAALHGPVYALALLLVDRGPAPPGATFASRWRSKVADLLALAAGFATTWALAVGVLWLQGAGSAAYEDIVRYGSALATLKVPDPNAPPKLVRWITGNADPQGVLPPPFGLTLYLVWWGTGSWPLWLAAIPSTAWLMAPAGGLTGRRPAGGGLDALRLGAGRLAGVVLAALLPPADARGGPVRGRRPRRLRGGDAFGFPAVPPKERPSSSRRSDGFSARNRAPEGGQVSPSEDADRIDDRARADRGRRLDGPAPGPRLPPGRPRGPDRPIQGRPTMGDAPIARPGAGPAVESLVRSDTLHLGLAEPTVHLFRARRPDPAFLRRPLARRLFAGASPRRPVGPAPESSGSCVTWRPGRPRWCWWPIPPSRRASPVPGSPLPPVGDRASWRVAAPLGSTATITPGSEAMGDRPDSGK